MSTRFVLAAIAAVILAACASAPSQPLGPPPPVKVVVTAAPSLHNLINVRKITAQTELALRRYAPAASPSTVTVHFTGTTLMYTEELERAEMNGSAAHISNPEPVTYRQTVANFSGNSDPQTVASPSRTTPWLDGFLPPTLSQNVQPTGRQLVVQGTYSIVDANGVTLEEDTIMTWPGASQPKVAKKIAERVALLAHGS